MISLQVHPMARKRLCQIPFVLVTCIILIGYVALNTKGSFRFHEIANFMNYNMLAQAMLAGQLHLKQEIDPERAKAADPSDPTLPYPFLRDAIAFNGKYYFLQQPFPAVFHAIWIVCTGRSWPTGLAVVCGATTCLFLLGLILCKIRKLFFPHTPRWTIWFTWLSFGLSGSQLYVVSGFAWLNETTIVGIMFVLAAVFSFISAVTSERDRISLFAVSGILFGTAVTCKASLIVYPLSFFACWAYASWFKALCGKDFIRKAFSFLLPVGCCIIILMTYNYARFGGVLDFGREHCIIPSGAFYRYCCVEGHFFRIEHVVHNLYNYLASLPSIVRGANYYWLWYGGAHVTVSGNTMMIRADLIALPLIMPVLAICLLLPWSWRSIKPFPRLQLIIASCVVSSTAMFALFTLYYTAAGRFVYEFTPLLFVVIYCVITVFFSPGVRCHGIRHVRIAALWLLFGINALMGFASAFNGAIHPG